MLSAATSPRTLRQCRRCDGVEPSVRFGQLARTICLSCQAEARVARARLVESTRRAARPGRSPAHLDWIRTLPCAIRPRCGRTPIHAHHVRLGTGGGTGRKPDDRWAVPLCGNHHGELHQIGARTFELRYTVDLRALAERLASTSPHLSPANEP